MVMPLAEELMEGYYWVPWYQEELNLFDNSVAPFGFAQMAPDVNVIRAHALILSIFKSSLTSEVER